MKALTTHKTWDRPSPVKLYPQPKLCWSDKETIRVLHPFLSTKRNGNLLEMGCGDSYWLSYFAREYGFSVCGIDFSDERLQRTQMNLDATGVCGNLVLGDITDAGSIPDEWLGAFDIVYSAGTVEHFRPPSNILRSFADLLKPDGLLITAVPHLKGFWGKMDTKLNKNSMNEHVWLDLPDLVDEHHRAGLRVTYSEYFRWLDFSILNFSVMHKIPRMICYASASATGIVIGKMVGLCPVKRLPSTPYASILVVAMLKL